MDADGDLERDNASQSGQEATRDQTEVSSSVRDQHHTLSIFRQFDPPLQTEETGEFKVLGRSGRLIVDAIDVNLDIPVRVWAETCPELTGRVINITDADYVNGTRKTEVSRPTAFLTVDGARLPVVETAMNRQLQRRPISRGRVY